MRDLIHVQAQGETRVPGDERPIAVPSGQKVTLIETIWNIRGPEGLAARFRFLAPAIARVGGTVDAETAQADMLALCRDFALARVATATGPLPQSVIISLSDQIVPFGESRPEVTQYFEFYALADGDCVWRMF